MRGVRKRIKVVAQIFVKQCVVTNLIVERLELFGRGQLAVDEEPGNFEERRLLSQLIDWVATIAQDSLITIDECDCRLGGGSVDKPVVERCETGLTREATDVD